MGNLTMDQLDTKIKDTATELMKEFVSKKVADTVKEAMEKNMAPSEEIKGLTNQQAEMRKAIDALTSATKGKSTLSSQKREREKGEAFGTCVRALWKAKNDIGGASTYLKKEGHEDL